MVTKTLEDFIKVYLNNKLVSEGNSDYASWKRKYGIDTGALIASGLIKQDTAYRKALSNYGRSAEGLGSKGLTKSGYASYLDEKAKEGARSALLSLDEGYASTEAKNRSGYESYLADELKKKDKLIKEATSKLKSEGFTSYEDAYAAATEMGVEDGEAMRIAKEVTEKKVSELRLKVISAIVNKGFTAEETEKYAGALGLPNDVIKELSELARSTNQQISLGNQTSYLDYLRQLAKEKAGK